MADNMVVCRAGKDDLQKLLDLHDLLATTREVIKRFPQTGFKIIADPQKGTITCSIDFVDDRLATEVKRAFPSLDGSSILVFCS
jgi:hypothetical protein